MESRAEDFVDPSRPDVVDGGRADEVVILKSDGVAEEKPADEGKKPQKEAKQKRLPPSEDDDGETYSQRVQRRINREIALRRRVEQRLDETTAETMELRERLAKLERQAKESITSAQAATQIADIQKKIDELKAKLSDAIENGKTAEQLELNIQLADLVSDMKLAKFRAEQALQKEKETQNKDTQEEKERTPPVVASWIAANKRWWNLSRFRDAKADAITIDKQIMEEIRAGELEFELYSEDHLRELAVRLKEAYPELDVRDPDGEAVGVEAVERDLPVEKARPKAPPVGAMNRSGLRSQSEEAAIRSGRVRLTNQDFATMRVFGLDPNNEKHRERFARERQRTILEGGR